MEGSPLGDRLTRYVSATAKAREVPKEPPIIPGEILGSISEKISIEDAPFLPHLARVRVEWLESELPALQLNLVLKKLQKELPIHFLSPFLLQEKVQTKIKLM